MLPFHSTDAVFFMGISLVGIGEDLEWFILRGNDCSLRERCSKHSRQSAAGSPRAQRRPARQLASFERRLAG
jgi:hypothetical protein